jgi:molybdate transport system substrate-binding protein
VKRLLALLFATLLPAVGAPAERPREPLLVFAAASLTDVLSELQQLWRKSSGAPVKLSFAASSMLARQIEAGGRADLFISADQQWMDYLATRGLIDSASRRNLAGNSLVLIAATRSSASRDESRLELGRGLDLAKALGGGRLAIADPDTVPAGRYARRALESLGLWNQASVRLARADNVRAALLFVARGESPLGIVYATDAQIEPNVRVLATFPDNSHEPITYPAAATASAGPDAAAFLAFLRSSTAVPVWKKHGFQEPRQ